MICSAFLFSYALENVIYNAFLEQAVMHSVHSRHSVPFFLLPELPVTSTSIWQTSLHLPQNTHLSLSQVALGSEKTAHCFRKTVMGHIFTKLHKTPRINSCNCNIYHSPFSAAPNISSATADARVLSTALLQNT